MPRSVSDACVLPISLPPNETKSAFDGSSHRGADGGFGSLDSRPHRSLAEDFVADARYIPIADIEDAAIGDSEAPPTVSALRVIA